MQDTNTCKEKDLFLEPEVWKLGCISKNQGAVGQKRKEILWKDVCVTLNQHRALIHEKERRSVFRSLCMMNTARSQRGYNVQPTQGDCSHELLFWTLEFLSQKSADILFGLLTQTLRANSISTRLQRNLHNKTSKKVAWQWVQSELYMTVTHKMSNLHLQYLWWDMPWLPSTSTAPTTYFISSQPWVWG